jgi:NADH:ubiquinone oxidoreductase subunit 2 (subunit N)
LLFSSLLSLIIGTVVGLTQSRIKRLFAFSTISHVGFILLGLTIHTVESTQAFMFYLIQYSISNLNAFILIITIGYSLYCYVYNPNSIDANSIDGEQKDNSREIHDGIDNTNEISDEKNNRREIHDGMDNTKEISDEKNNSREIQDGMDNTKEISDEKNNRREIQDGIDNTKKISDEKENLQDLNNSPIQLIDQLKGYYYINPFLSLSLAITLFSFAGIPPLIGFFGKQMILSAAIDNGYIFMSLVAILTSVISAVYYLTIIKQIFFDKNDYTLNEQLESLNADGLISEKDSIVEEVNIKMKDIVISSSLSLAISVITLIITLFIFIPEELLSLANILALFLFNL